MNTGKKELQSILQELEELKLPHMATKLEELYHQPAFVDTGRLELISAIVHEEYTAAIENRYTSRLKKAKLRGSDNCLDQCVDSKELLRTIFIQTCFQSGSEKRKPNCIHCSRTTHQKNVRLKKHAKPRSTICMLRLANSPLRMSG